MKTFIVAALSIASASANNQAHEHYKFLQFVTKHEKSYTTVDEYKQRLDLFLETEALIRQHNNDFSQNYSLGHNHMSDWTQEEYKELRQRKFKSELTEDEESYEQIETFGKQAEPVDWRTLGKVTPVTDQGNCGNCWAHASTGAMESAHAIANDIEPVQLSVQQLTDCIYSLGCRGGWENDAFDYFKKHDAVLASDYPLQSNLSTLTELNDRRKGIRCLDKNMPATGIRDQGHMNVAKNSVDQMKAALALGPVTVGIDAEPRSFMNYKSGIYDNERCGTDLDHAVLAVGWGKQGLQEYYIVRNSWAADWGEEGYIKMAIQEGHGICGIQKDPHYPDHAN